MRTTNERMAELRRRVQKNKIRRHRFITGVCSFAACLILIACAALAMPEVIRQTANTAYTYSGSAASIFADSKIIGFVIIGILSFALGVCVTILCNKLHCQNLCDKEKDND